MHWSEWARFLFTGWGVPFTVYLVLQVTSALVLSGRLRIISLVPIPFMLAMSIVSVLALQSQSNMWPIWLILLSPIAVIFLSAVLIRHFLTRT
jgi:hypothetical protein